MIQAPWGVHIYARVYVYLRFGVARFYGENIDKSIIVFVFSSATQWARVCKSIFPSEICCRGTDARSCPLNWYSLINYRTTKSCRRGKFPTTKDFQVFLEKHFLYLAKDTIFEISWLSRANRLNLNRASLAFESYTVIWGIWKIWEICSVFHHSVTFQIAQE